VAATLASACPGDPVPGIGSTCGDLASSQASTICRGLASCRLAASGVAVIAAAVGVLAVSPGKTLHAPNGPAGGGVFASGTANGRVWRLAAVVVSPLGPGPCSLVMSQLHTWLGAVAASSGLTVGGWVACRRRSRVSPAWRNTP
jgi:hypothetical protein